MEESKKIENIILAIMILPILSIIALVLIFIISVNKVYALEVRPTNCISASDNFSITDCSKATNLTIGKSNYVNVITTYPSGLQEKTYNFSLYYDLYDIDALKRDNLYIRTPIVHIYVNGIEVSTQAPTIIQTQRAWCEGSTGCWRIRTFLTNFQWRGNLSNASITWNIRSYTGNGYIDGWIEPHTGVLTSTGPYYTYGQTFATYSDDTQQAVENQTNEMQEGFANVNENNNRNTEDIKNALKEVTNGIREKIEKQFNACENINIDKNSNNLEIGKRLNSNGEIQTSNNTAISPYIKITQLKDYIITQQGFKSSTNSYCLYGEEKSLINCEAYNQKTTITINNQNAYYIRYTIQTSTNDNTTLTGEYCGNLIEEQVDKINEILHGPNYNKVDVDDKTFEDYEDKENILYGNINMEEIENIDIETQDFQVDASQFIWEYIYNWLNSNAKVFSMFITLLVLGIIKLVF